MMFTMSSMMTTSMMSTSVVTASMMSTSVMSSCMMTSVMSTMMSTVMPSMMNSMMASMMTSMMRAMVSKMYVMVNRLNHMMVLMDHLVLDRWIRDIMLLVMRIPVMHISMSRLFCVTIIPHLLIYYVIQFFFEIRTFFFFNYMDFFYRLFIVLTVLKKISLKK